MWTYLILAWLGVNVILVLLLWHRAQRLEREETARIPPTAPDAALVQPPRRPRLEDTSATWPLRETASRVVVVRGERPATGSEPLLPALQHCKGLTGTGEPAGCRMREMQAEIRELRLAVAELSLDKARLSSAMARMRC